jgi:ribonuclease BN (tRNA processing enzyme)
MRLPFAGFFALVSLTACAQLPGACPPVSGIAVQVLGSGGPIADDKRASTAYLVWVDGKSKFLIDAGGGSFVRFAETGASFNDLDFVGLSHFHTDHSADFVALLKSGNFSGRERSLSVAGPSGDGPFPGFDAFLQSLIGENGAYAYLSGYLDGSGGLVRLETSEVSDPATVFDDPDGEIRVDAMHVPHGIVPALAFRVQIGDTRVVFATDQNGSDPDFAAFAKGADLLVMHLVIPQDATGVASRLHARPGVVGSVAAAASAQQLLLSHFMARSLRDLDGNVAIVRARYDGVVHTADDLMCIAL